MEKWPDIGLKTSLCIGVLFCSVVACTTLQGLDSKGTALVLSLQVAASPHSYRSASYMRASSIGPSVGRGARAT